MKHERENNPANRSIPSVSRRRLLQAAASGLTLLVPGAAIATEAPTAAQPRGPFYPDRIPLDKDNDLVRVEGRDGIAEGKITDLQGRVLDPNGGPVEGALVEIWQCDANGRYIHRLDDRRVPRDPNFQGYGRFETTADGRYGFRTIKPVPDRPATRNLRPLARWFSSGRACFRLAEDIGRLFRAEIFHRISLSRLRRSRPTIK